MLKNSKPCLTCLNTLQTKMKIRNIYYSNDNGDWVKESMQNMSTTHLSRRNKLANMCALIFIKINKNLNVW